MRSGGESGREGQRKGDGVMRGEVGVVARRGDKEGKRRGGHQDGGHRLEVGVAGALHLVQV